MPELPEVESSRVQLEKALIANPRKTSKTSVISISPNTSSGVLDDIICECSIAELEAALVGKVVSKICRKGKQMWFEMKGSDIAILFHFGMTGVHSSFSLMFSLSCFILFLLP